MDLEPGRDSAKAQSFDPLNHKVTVYIGNPLRGTYEMGYTRKGESRPHCVSLADQEVRRQEPGISVRSTRDNSASRQGHRSNSLRREGSKTNELQRERPRECKLRSYHQAVQTD